MENADTPDSGTAPDLLAAVAQILGPDGQVVGAGFLVSEGVLVTCAHVIQAAGGGPGATVHVTFPHVEGAHRVEGDVSDELWRAPEDGDVAVIRLNDTPRGTKALPVGSAVGCRGHHVRSFGFPAQARPEGHFGFGVVGDLLPASAGQGALLQLTSANDLTAGFSGGPVLDEVTGLDIGMLTEITAPDAYERGQGIAYVIPVQVLREIVPALALREVCPYRGLEPFTAEQAQWFEGRKDAVRQVVAYLAGQRRLALLLGPSGSGKSSLIQAGVLRALAAGALPGSDRWLSVLARPGQDLLAGVERSGLPGASAEGIAKAVTRKLAANPGYQRVLLVIDQFEELFTQPADGRQQRRLAAADQITAAAESDAALSVLLVMRDDFYPQLAALAPKLLEAAMPGLLNVPGTLSEADLHDIITLPAQDVGLQFQPGLPEQIISDVLAITPGAAASRQAPVTVLPLLELTLSQLWLRRQDGYLTHVAYRRIGAVSGSLTTWCDNALKELSPEQRLIARRILTSLVHPTDPSRNVAAVRAQVPLRELRDLGAAPGGAPDGGQAVDQVMATLTRHRIMTTQTLRASPSGATAPPGEPVAELVHDALIRDWGVLREWVSQDHRFQDWLDNTRERHARWTATADSGDLLGGSALAEGLEWSRQRRLPADIAAFLAASKQRQQAIVRRSRRLNAILASLLVLALGAAGGFLWQWHTADTERKASQSRQLAEESNTLFDKNPDLASLLAIQAYHTSQTPEALASLRNAAAVSFPLRRRLVVHTREVYSVAFSPDGRTLATGSIDHTARLRDMATGKTRIILTGHTGPVWSVAFSPDGRTLATASQDRTVRLWDVATGKTRRILTGHHDWVSWVAFSRDGRTLATASKDHTARLWDVATGKTRIVLKGHHNWVYSVAFSPDGRTLATASKDHTARLWDVATGKPRTTLTGHTDEVWAVQFSPDGRTLATGSSDQTVRLWNLATGKFITLTGHTAQAWAVAFSPDGRTLVTASADETVRLWDVATGKTRTTLTGHTGEVEAVAFSRDGRTLATASDDKTVRLWDLATPASKTRTTLNGHTGPVGSLAFDPDGRILATGSDDKTVRLWDLVTGKTRTIIGGQTDEVWAMRFSPDGHTLAIGCADGRIRLWNVTAGETRIILKGHTDKVTSVSFSPGGHTLATSGYDETVRLWDVATGRLLRTIAVSQGAGFSANSVAFSPDGHTLALGMNDNTVRLWDVATGKIRTTLTGHTDVVTSVAFSPDGHTLATGSADKTARLWDVSTGKTRTILAGHTDVVQSVAFSPDGHTLATGSADKTARLWDVATGRALTTFTGHTNWVLAVEFSPDQGTLATGSGDKTVRLWDSVLLRPDTAIRTICQHVNRDLTTDERAAYLPDQSVSPACHPT
ncbi:trypsin-like peptidase domain-containing protein [Streptomyces naphthomycinicus]|uniref:nSTAND1 domain-containing NTPase n=1 Tax=Streptomyces naphthomycinicus TaxID=2872625 RepID=UPI001CED4FD3|nr:trypsin-like peptidase domain-containing protein [Streptomyces sp. TML10]